MDAPLSLDMLLQTFARYNTLLWPWNWGVFLLASVALLLVFRRPTGAPQFITTILGILWVWVGICFFIISFAPVYPLAKFMGGLFIIQGVAFLYATGRRSLVFAWRADFYGATGLMLALFGLVLYPLTGYLAGAVYPQIPIVGAPCPAVIFTFGLLLLTAVRVPLLLLVIPLLWAVGAVVPIAAGMWSDLVLLAGGVMASIMIMHRNRQHVEQTIENNDV